MEKFNYIQYDTKLPVLYYDKNGISIRINASSINIIDEGNSYSIIQIIGYRFDKAYRFTFKESNRTARLSELEPNKTLSVNQTASETCITYGENDYKFSNGYKYIEVDSCLGKNFADIINDGDTSYVANNTQIFEQFEANLASGLQSYLMSNSTGIAMNPTSFTKKNGNVSIINASSTGFLFNGDTPIFTSCYIEIRRKSNSTLVTTVLKPFTDVSFEDGTSTSSDTEGSNTEETTT